MFINTFTNDKYEAIQYKYGNVQDIRTFLNEGKINPVIMTIKPHIDIIGLLDHRVITRVDDGDYIIKTIPEDSGMPLFAVATEGIFRSNFIEAQ